MHFDGGWHLFPRRTYLAEAEDAEDLIAMFARGQELMDEVQRLDSELREQIRKRRRERLRLSRIRKELFENDFTFRPSREEELREKQRESVERYNELNERVEELQDRHEEVARFIDRHYVGVQTVKEPDLTPPDEQKVGEQVGAPANDEWY